MKATIVLAGVTAGYARNQNVLEGLSLRLEPGLNQIVGRNGSGKSTLLDVMAGTLPVRSGTATLMGHAAQTASAWNVRSVSRARVALFPGLTVSEHVSLLDLGHRVDRVRLERRLDVYGLSPWYEVPTSELSTGNLRKAWIVLSTAAEREIILLDEPFTGLDTTGGEILVEEITGWRRSGRTVVLVTHQQERGIQPDLITDIESPHAMIGV